MPRIRTVKPSFFDDEKMGAVSRDARLTFIGLLVNSDDYGVVKGHPAWLRNRIFPYDDITLAEFTGWLQELEQIRSIIPFSSNGENYFYIRNFNRHQKINRPSKIRNPQPPREVIMLAEKIPSLVPHGARSEDSVRTHGDLSEDSLMEREGEGERELVTSPRGDVVDEPASPDVDLALPEDGLGSEKATEKSPKKNTNRFGPNDLGRLWNEVADPVFPRVILPFSEKRARKFRPAIRERPDPEWWRELFLKAGGVPFLRGENDRGWRADLEFVVRRREEGGRTWSSWCAGGRKSWRANTTGPARVHPPSPSPGPTPTARSATATGGCFTRRTAKTWCGPADALKQEKTGHEESNG